MAERDVPVTTGTYRVLTKHLTFSESTEEHTTMAPDNRIARTAGLLYLIMVVTGMFSLAYVPSHIDTHADALATTGHIVTSLSLFRWGTLSELIMAAAFLMLPLILYQLLHHVNRNLAALMVVLVAVSIPISFVNVAHKLDILSLLGNTDVSQVFTRDQLNAQVMMHLVDYRNGTLVSEIFWGLWLLPFGYLVFKSTFLPRILGVLLMLGGFSYLIDFSGTMLFPGYGGTTLAGLIMLPASLGEIGTCLWLLIIGTRHRTRQSTDASTDTQWSGA